MKKSSKIVQKLLETISNEICIDEKKMFVCAHC
jgi:hypothetical protein